MPFEDLAAFIDPGFELPIRGKTYRVPAPSAKDGLFLQAIVDSGESMIIARSITRANRKVLSDEDERSTYQMALGPVYDELVDDGVEWPILKHAGMTALIHWTRVPEAAETLRRITRQPHSFAFGRLAIRRLYSAARRPAG